MLHIYPVSIQLCRDVRDINRSVPDAALRDPQRHARSARASMSSKRSSTPSSAKKSESV